MIMMVQMLVVIHLQLSIFNHKSDNKYKLWLLIHLSLKLDNVLLQIKISPLSSCKVFNKLNLQYFKPFSKTLIF